MSASGGWIQADFAACPAKTDCRMMGAEYKCAEYMNLLQWYDDCFYPCKQGSRQIPGRQETILNCKGARMS